MRQGGELYETAPGEDGGGLRARRSGLVLRVAPKMGWNGSALWLPGQHGPKGSTFAEGPMMDSDNVHLINLFVINF